MPSEANPFRQLPSIDSLLEHDLLAAEIAFFGRASTRDVARQVLEEARVAIASGATPLDIAALIPAVSRTLREKLSPTLRRALNATGVIIHTNLGRAPLSTAAQQAMLEISQGYSNLEYDLAAGKRGSRYTHAEQMLCELTGAEAALVVNNNAAAITLALRELAADRDVLVSRGELVEIGGGFRIPDILRQSNARLVEVGSTNRTHFDDYAGAITADTAAMLKVHRSNFRIVGFSEEVELSRLVELGKSREVFVLDDLGSGTLLDTTPFGLDYEPTVQDSVRTGADLTTFSGDKLLGGPQAGIIVGKRELVDRLRKQPLTRALRVDKLTLAALQATLLSYLRGAATAEIPVWQMISASEDSLQTRAGYWVDVLTRAGLETRMKAGLSTVGGGSLPGQMLPTTLVVLAGNADALAAKLRSADQPIIGRIDDDDFLLDPRTILPDQEETLLAVLKEALVAGIDA